MSSALHIEEQDKIDQLKSFWNTYGNLITWLLILACAVVAAWNGWSWWQQRQSTQAAAMFDELDQAVQIKDLTKAERVLNDLKQQYPRTIYTQQGGLLTAHLQFINGKPDVAATTLGGVADSAPNQEYKAIALLRLSGILLEQKKYDEALKKISDVKPVEFTALADDRRGDILLAQGKKEDAQKAFTSAYQKMSEELAYRRLIEAKLVAMGVAPPDKSASAAAVKPR
jgi:predicted negative regulator of RcsB-dependent stress response